MLTSDNLAITAKVYAANTAKATIFNPTPKPITLGAETLYCGAKEACRVEASMKRHILAAAFDQGNSQR